MSNFILKDVPERVDALLEGGGDGTAEPARLSELREEVATYADPDAPTSRTEELTDEELQERIEDLLRYHQTLGSRYHMDDDTLRTWIAEGREAKLADVVVRTPAEVEEELADLRRFREASGLWLDPDDVDRWINEHRM